jgi:hypothetical protein
MATVRRAAEGDAMWAGAGGTSFTVDPKEKIVGVFLSAEAQAGSSPAEGATIALAASFDHLVAGENSGKATWNEVRGKEWAQLGRHFGSI